MPRGSRVFLMRLGEEPKGLVGSGWTTSTPKKRLHWDPDRAANGDKIWSVDFDFDLLREMPLVTSEGMFNLLW
jgi:5-methylcytosine-specific restriction enzyme A